MSRPRWFRNAEPDRYADDSLVGSTLFILLARLALAWLWWK